MCSTVEGMQYGEGYHQNDGAKSSVRCGGYIQYSGGIHVFSVRKSLVKSSSRLNEKFRKFIAEFFIPWKVFELVFAENRRTPRLLRILYFNEEQSLPKVYL